MSKLKLNRAVEDLLQIIKQRERTRDSYDDEYASYPPDDCYCTVDNAPCQWCETHGPCDECQGICHKDDLTEGKLGKYYCEECWEDFMK